MNIVLTGFMASGKTEIGKAIAEMSKYKFLDTDNMITEKFGMSINEIFAKYGEEYFREAESEVIKEAAEAVGAVIATGGGVPLNGSNIAVLRKSGIIFNLAPDFSVIRERLEEARKSRPLLRGESIEDIEKRFNDRLPFYNDCDHKIHIINGRTPRSYALEILNIVQSNNS